MVLQGLRPKDSTVLPSQASTQALDSTANQSLGLQKATAHPRSPKLKPLFDTHGAMQQGEEKEL